MRIIPRPLRTAVNRLSHAAGTAHAAEVKQRLLERLKALQESGATLPEMLAAVEAWPTTTTKGETK